MIVRVTFTLLIVASNLLARGSEEIKAEIFREAEKYTCEGDPNSTKQNELIPLVKELLESSPQPPIKQRIKLLTGPWKQVFGALDYRNDKRGKDPKLTPDQIYQVISEDGYYYNINPIKGTNKIGLLRGKYSLVDGYENMLKVRFTSYPGNLGIPKKMKYWQLANLAEKGELPDKITIVPTLFVWLFFGGGYLEEIYTDDTLRITYGSSKIKNRKDKYLYIMKRAD